MEFSDQKRGSIVRLADGLVRLRAPVTRAALSPDGRYVAWTPHDDATRSDVVVTDVVTGEDFLRLRGSAVRHVEWCAPTRLLVVREGAMGAHRMTVHELPDGGAVAECGFPEGVKSVDRVEVSRDGRHVCVHDASYWPYVSCTRALPDLAVAGDIERGSTESALDVALHPDGHELAVLMRAPGGMSLAVLSARDGTVRRAAKLTGLANLDAPLWASAARLVLRVDAGRDSAVVDQPAAGAEVFAVTVSTLVGGRGFAFTRLAVSPTRAAVVGALRPKQYPAPRAVVAVDVNTGAVLARREVARRAYSDVTGAMTVDDRGAVVALAAGEGTMLVWVGLDRGEGRELDVPDSRMSRGVIAASVIPAGVVPVLEPLVPRGASASRPGWKVLLLSLDALRTQGKAAAG